MYITCNSKVNQSIVAIILDCMENDFLYLSAICAYLLKGLEQIAWLS